MLHSPAKPIDLRGGRSFGGPTTSTTPAVSHQRHHSGYVESRAPQPNDVVPSGAGIYYNCHATPERYTAANEGRVEYLPVTGGGASPSRVMPGTHRNSLSPSRNSRSSVPQPGSGRRRSRGSTKRSGSTLGGQGGPSLHGAPPMTATPQGLVGRTHLPLEDVVPTGASPVGVSTASASSASDSAGNRFFKTRLCLFHQKGLCVRGDKCSYAHDGDELRATPNLIKTRLCQDWLNGRCTAEQCKFAHGRNELRFIHDYYKTKLCNFWQQGGCSKGHVCRHAHGEAELRPMPPGSPEHMIKQQQEELLAAALHKQVIAAAQLGIVANEIRAAAASVESAGDGGAVAPNDTGDFFTGPERQYVSPEVVPHPRELTPSDGRGGTLRGRASEAGGRGRVVRAASPQSPLKRESSPRASRHDSFARPHDRQMYAPAAEDRRGTISTQQVIAEDEYEDDDELMSDLEDQRRLGLIGARRIFPKSTHDLVMVPKPGPPRPSSPGLVPASPPFRASSPGPSPHSFGSTATTTNSNEVVVEALKLAEQARELVARSTELLAGRSASSTTAPTSASTSRGGSVVHQTKTPVSHAPVSVARLRSQDPAEREPLSSFFTPAPSPSAAARTFNAAQGLGNGKPTSGCNQPWSSEVTAAAVEAPTSGESLNLEQLTETLANILFNTTHSNPEEVVSRRRETDIWAKSSSSQSRPPPRSATGSASSKQYGLHALPPLTFSTSAV